MAKKSATKAPKVTKKMTRDDGLLITNRMRRDARAAAAAEVAAAKVVASYSAAKIATEEAEDAELTAAYLADPTTQEKSEAEKTVDAEKAQAIATAEARKAAGLK